MAHVIHPPPIHLYLQLVEQQPSVCVCARIMKCIMPTGQQWRIRELELMKNPLAGMEL